MGQTKKQPWFCDKLPFRLRHLRFNLIEQSERPFSWYLWTFNLFPSGRYHIIILEKWNPFSVVFEISVWQTSLPEGSLRSHMMPGGSVPQWNDFVVWYDTSPAVPAFTDIHAPEVLYDFRPGLVFQLWKAGSAARQVPAQGDELLLIAGSQDSVMPDTDKALRRHMHQEPADKLHPGNRKCFSASAIFIVLDRKGDRFFIHT